MTMLNRTHELHVDSSRNSVSAMALLRYVFACWVSLANLVFNQSVRAEQTVSKTTHVYKTVGDLPIQLDVIRPHDQIQRQLIVWIHGGALINGHRESVPGRIQSMLLNAGYAIASIDYRLAPETKLPEILSDVEDAFSWLRTSAPAEQNLDTSRIGVIGGSAGGYLTLSSGHRVHPRPTVLVSLWGYGDLIGDWYSQPSPHPRHNQRKLSKEQVSLNVQGPPIADSRNRQGGGEFYIYCRQQGTWPREVSGWDPHTAADKFQPFMPVLNVTPEYPPTLLIHGTNDTDVPYEQSVLMQQKFQQHGVEHELITIRGGEHGLAGGDSMEIEAAYERMLTFVNQHMRQ